MLLWLYKIKRIISSTRSLTLLTTLLTWSCSTTPITDRKALNAIPQGQLSEMGQSTFEQMKQKEKRLPDGPLKRQIVEIGKRIAAASGVDFDWEFEVFDAPQTVNAFCLPGGKIGVYTGILPVAENTAGLAAILGHEVAHATANHGGERLTQNMLLQTGLQLADLTMMNSKYRSLLMAGLGVGAQVGVLLPYSRLHESEADEIGLVYMAKAGYDPSEAPKLWKRMAAAGSGGTPSFLSTHPDPNKRAKELKEQQSEVQAVYRASKQQETKTLMAH